MLKVACTAPAALRGACTAALTCAMGNFPHHACGFNSLLLHTCWQAYLLQLQGTQLPCAAAYASAMGTFSHCLRCSRSLSLHLLLLQGTERPWAALASAVGGSPHRVRCSNRLPSAHAGMATCVLQGTEGPWAAAFASAMGGSPTMYSASEPAEGSWWANGDGRKWVGGRTPTTSINFVTAHDGFALADLVTYNEKHNEANGEDNRWAGLTLNDLAVWEVHRAS